MMRIFLLALLLVPAVVTLVAPTASAGCLSRSTDADGHNVTFRVGFPTKPDYICAPYFAVDGNVLLP